MLATLHRVKASKKDPSGFVIFYFTDNMTTYCVVQNGCLHNPRLHELVRAFKHIEMDLQCQVEVVHVPGTTMIGQATDGLSRGVRCTALHDSHNQRQLVGAVCVP
jgi:hypothetical protein